MTAPANHLDLAVAITAHDSMRTIERTLRSVLPIARRIVVVDSGSTDGTPETCRVLGAEVIEHPWSGYLAQKQFAIDQCREEAWILLLDSDESLEDDLRDSMARAIQQDDPNIAGWSFNRKVWFLGGWLHHVYQPDWLLRLFRRGRGRMTGGAVHEGVTVDGPTGRLAGVCRHDSWADVRDMARRQLRYAEEMAQANQRGGSIGQLLLSPPLAMLKQLIIKRGFLDGTRGLIAAGMTFNYTMLKHAHMAAQRLARTKADD